MAFCIGTFVCSFPPVREDHHMASNRFSPSRMFTFVLFVGDVRPPRCPIRPPLHAVMANAPQTINFGNDGQRRSKTWPIENVRTARFSERPLAFDPVQPHIFQIRCTRCASIQQIIVYETNQCCPTKRKTVIYTDAKNTHDFPNVRIACTYISVARKFIDITSNYNIRRIRKQ